MKSANASSTPTSVSIKRLGTDDGDDDDTFLFRSKDGVVVVLVDKVLLSFPKLNPLSLLVVVVVSNDNPLSLVVVVLNDNPLSLVVVVPNDNPPPVVSLLVVEDVPNVNPIELESTILNPPNEGPSFVSSLFVPGLFEPQLLHFTKSALFGTRHTSHFHESDGGSIAFNASALH